MNWECRFLRAFGRGRSKITSISNIKKMTASKKNRRENGIRADLLGSNPHSNGEVFSRSLRARVFRNQASANTKAVIRRAINVIEVDWIILLRPRRPSSD